MTALVLGVSIIMLLISVGLALYNYLDDGVINYSFFILGFFALFVLYSVSSIYDEGYKTGQIDALSGKVMFEKQENTEIIWKRKIITEE